MDNNFNNNDIENEINEEQKIKSEGCFYRGVATGVTITLVVLIIALVLNILITKDYIETDDRDQMMDNAGLGINSENVEISDEMMEIFAKAQYLQEIIEENYYYEEDMNALANGIYSGMLNSLGDPYSVYYDEEAFQALMESTTGTYCGIGVVIVQDMETMVITVVTPYEGCPGYEAGILPGDIILGADDIDFTGMDSSEAVSYIKGEEGTTVTLHIKRGEKLMDIDVTRKMINIPTVHYEVLEGDIAYIIIESFDSMESTYVQFCEALEKAQADGCKGYIFDIRNNGGGMYDTVVAMLDDLLPKGKIVYTEDKAGNQETEYSDADYLDAPMAVLINGNSASASEIFAGAIQDYGAGKIIGTKSYGKGIVQSIMSLGDGTAVKVTVSSYFTPNGRNIHGEGITPDVLIELPQEEEAYENGYLKPEYDTQLNEAIKYIQGEID